MEIVENKTKGRIHYVPCLKCKRETNHIVLSSIKAIGRDFFDDEAYFQWEILNEIIQCQGCDEISFRQCASDSESYDDDKGIYYSTVTLYPKRTEETIHIKSYHNLPDNIYRLYKETIACYNNDIMTLCAGGVRAIVEGICLDKNIKDGEISYTDKEGNQKTKRDKNLQGKIQGLVEKHILTKDNAQSLDEHRILGNEALHELSLPSQEELSLAIRIIEHFLDNIYEIPEKTNELKKRRTTV